MTEDARTRLTQRLETAPQVRAAGLVQTVPIQGDYVLSFTIQGRPEARPGESPSANYRSASPRYVVSRAGMAQSFPSVVAPKPAASDALGSRAVRSMAPSCA